jgi:hypothetical protein
MGQQQQQQQTKQGPPQQGALQALGEVAAASLSLLQSSPVLEQQGALQLLQHLGLALQLAQQHQALPTQQMPATHLLLQAV